MVFWNSPHHVGSWSSCSAPTQISLRPGTIHSVIWQPWPRGKSFWAEIRFPEASTIFQVLLLGITPNKSICCPYCNSSNIKDDCYIVFDFSPSESLISFIPSTVLQIIRSITLYYFVTSLPHESHKLACLLRNGTWARIQTWIWLNFTENRDWLSPFSFCIRTNFKCYWTKILLIMFLLHLISSPQNIHSIFFPKGCMFWWCHAISGIFGFRKWNERF